jgi:hypothetical protein
LPGTIELPRLTDGQVKAYTPKLVAAHKLAYFHTCKTMLWLRHITGVATKVPITNLGTTKPQRDRIERSKVERSKVESGKVERSKVETNQI